MCVSWDHPRAPVQEVTPGDRLWARDDCQLVVNNFSVFFPAVDSNHCRLDLLYCRAMDFGMLPDGKIMDCISKDILRNWIRVEILVVLFGIRFRFSDQSFRIRMGSCSGMPDQVLVTLWSEYLNPMWISPFWYKTDPRRQDLIRQIRFYKMEQFWIQTGILVPKLINFKAFDDHLQN